MVEAWARIDRDLLLVRARQATAASDLIVVQGNDNSGRSVAADLIEEFLSVDLGQRVLRARGRGTQPDDAKQRLLDVWEIAAGEQPPGSLGPWLTQRSYISNTGIVDAIVDEVGADQIALVLDTVDSIGSLPDLVTSVYVNLWKRLSCPFFVFSRIESNTSWRRPCETFRLERITIDDVRAKLYPASAFLSVSVPTLDAIVDDLGSFTDNMGSIDAQDVYDVVSLGLAKALTQ